MTCSLAGHRIDSPDSDVSADQSGLNKGRLHYNMSSPAQSPQEPEVPEEVDVEPETTPTGDNEQQPEGEGDMNREDLGLGYDFDVKEQDRWLPIANGKCDTPCVTHCIL